MTNSNNHQLDNEIRFDWDKQEILEILNKPLIDLMWESQIAVSYTHLTLPTTLSV